MDSTLLVVAARAPHPVEPAQVVDEGLAVPAGRQPWWPGEAEAAYSVGHAAAIFVRPANRSNAAARAVRRFIRRRRASAA